MFFFHTYVYKMFMYIVQDVHKVVKIMDHKKNATCKILYIPQKVVKIQNGETQRKNHPTQFWTNLEPP
jgi:hypothetical protein